MSPLLAALRSGRVLLMDGAMGTQLQSAGMREGGCYELWNVTHPDAVRSIHLAYAAAGAQCLLSNTFQANPAVLARHGRQTDLETINRQGLALARSAAGAERFVLGDIGPMNWNGDDYERVVRSLAGADGLLLETWSGTGAVAAAERACRCAVEWGCPPVFLSFTFYLDGPTKTPRLREGGLEPQQAAELASKAGIAALGVNCGPDVSMDDVLEIIRGYRAVTDLPLFARPNAGSPTLQDGRWVYPHSPEEMAARLPTLLRAGTAMVGGCCGTTPAHIAAFRPVIDEWNGRRAAMGSAS